MKKASIAYFMANLSVFKHYFLCIWKGLKEKKNTICKGEDIRIRLLSKELFLVADYFLTVAVCICKEKFKVE